MLDRAGGGWVRWLVVYFQLWVSGKFYVAKNSARLSEQVAGGSGLIWVYSIPDLMTTVVKSALLQRSVTNIVAPPPDIASLRPFVTLRNYSLTSDSGRARVRHATATVATQSQLLSLVFPPSSRQLAPSVKCLRGAAPGSSLLPFHHAGPDEQAARGGGPAGLPRQDGGHQPGRKPLPAQEPFAQVGKRTGM